MVDVPIYCFIVPVFEFFASLDANNRIKNKNTLFGQF